MGVCARGVIPGDATIPALTFSFEDGRPKADGSNEVYRDELTTEPIQIYVKGSLADLKGPMSVPIPFEYKLLIWAAGTLLFVTAAAMFVRWMRKRASADSATHAEPALPPHIWALRELDRLSEERLIERGMIQEYYYRVNGLLRRYIELRFEVMAGEQTSEEFLHMLQDSFALSAPHKAMLQQFTSACDPVKYARQIPDREEIEWVGRSAREFIMQTVPTEAELAAARERTGDLEEVAA
ncbi:MAG: hypothetical protein IPK83_21030 [Planctomycetes bacterium]|nr:hypothetical protein [Planctomycetota bacterium]